VSDAPKKTIYLVMTDAGNVIPPIDDTTFCLEIFDDHFELTPQQASPENRRSQQLDHEDPVDVVKRWFYQRVVSVVPDAMPRGAFHPRIWRNGVIARHVVRDTHPSWHLSADWPVIRPRLLAYHQLQRRLATIFEVVTPAQASTASYGTAIQQVLALAAMEVETLLREAFNANSSTNKPHSSMNDWARLAAPMRIDAWTAKLEWFPEWPPMHPFKGWGPGAAPPWWTAYNKLKHDDSLRSTANFESAISAVAAVRILLEAQFGPGIAARMEDGGAAQIVTTNAPRWLPGEVYFAPRDGANVAVPAL